MESIPGAREVRYWRSLAGGLASEDRGWMRAADWLAMYGLARIVAVRRLARGLARLRGLAPMAERPSLF